MKKKIIKGLKILNLLILAGAVAIIMKSCYKGCFIKRKGVDLKNSFSAPVPITALSDVRIAELHYAEYLNKTYIIESKNAFGFDESGQPIHKEGEKSEVIIENIAEVLDKETLKLYHRVDLAKMYEHLIKNQYDVYSHFKDMRDLYERYLALEPEVKLEKSKGEIYERCYDYVVANATEMGDCRYSELDKEVQDDVLEFFTDVSYMQEKGVVRPKENADKLGDIIKKGFVYGLFGKGRK